MPQGIRKQRSDKRITQFISRYYILYHKIDRHIKNPILWGFLFLQLVIKKHLEFSNFDANGIHGLIN